MKIEDLDRQELRELESILGQLIMEYSDVMTLRELYDKVMDRLEDMGK